MLNVKFHAYKERLGLRKGLGVAKAGQGLRRISDSSVKVSSCSSDQSDAKVVFVQAKVNRIRFGTPLLS